jgi:membrane protein implicated in regulation of membrane protease activity
VAAPIAIAFMLYRAPVWLGADPSEYSAWVLAFVVPWSIAGVTISVVVTRWLGARVRESNSNLNG